MRTDPAPLRAIQRAPAVWVALLALLLSGCGALSGGVYDAPLPGGADVGDDPMTVTAEFADVLDLVPQSSVKVDNVAVGRVQKVTLAKDGKTAEVELTVRGDLDLPTGTTARLQQTSLLGEKYVALLRPEEPAQGTARLADGDVLSPQNTDAAATAEQVLGSLSLLLNGGGVGQFQEISRELQQVGGGRTEEVKVFLQEVNRFVGVLDTRRDAITGAIDGLARLSKTLDGDREKIASALEGLSPGMRVLAQQRPQLTRMLQSLDRLSKVTVRTLNSSQDDIVRDFELLAPILRQLAKSGQDLPHSLEILLTYPFPDSVLGAIRGDYLNVFMTTNYRTLPTGCEAIGCLWLQPADPSAGVRPPGAPARPIPPPALLPPTNNATPESPSPTAPGPSIAPSAPGSDEPSSPEAGPSTPGGADSGGSEGPGDPESIDPAPDAGRDGSSEGSQ